MSRDQSKTARDTREIESDLADTRARIDHTLEFLEDRFRPSVIMDQAWRYARTKSEDGGTTRLQETIAHNPLPVVLMGVGLAWLLFSGREGSVPRPESPLSEGARRDPDAKNATAAGDKTSSARDESSSARHASTARASADTRSSESGHKSDPDTRQRRDEQSSSAGFTEAASSEPTEVAPDQSHPGDSRAAYGKDADSHDRRNT